MDPALAWAPSRLLNTGFCVFYWAGRYMFFLDESAFRFKFSFSMSGTVELKKDRVCAKATL